MSGLFGTSGIRGIVNKDHYPDFYLHMGLVIGSVLKDKEAAIAADGRVTMPIVKNAVLSGLTATGRNVIDVGILPTPALQYYCKVKHVTGIMITASHNPAEYNGIKLVTSDGMDIYREEHKQIEELYYKNQFSENAASKRSEIGYVTYDRAGKIRTDRSGTRVYVEGISKLVDVEKIRKAKLRVLFDCVNGATTQTTPALFDKLGIEAVPLNEKLDGSFPAHRPEPIEANLKDTMKAVKECGADFGIVFDSDGDRSVFISPKGEYIDGNFSVPMIMGKKLRKGDSVVTPVNSADTFQRVADEMGVSVFTTKIGRQNIAHEMLKRNSMLGGEENGAVMFAPHQFGGDGGMALGLMAEAVAEDSFENLLDGVPRLFYFRDKVYSEIEFGRVKGMLLEVKHIQAEEMDGIKIRLDKDRWVMARRSGTEPVYRIYAQAKSKEEVASLVSTYKKKLFGE